MNKIRRIFGLGSTAILDQALFAGANFLINLMLIRYISAREYGVFAMVYSLYLFATSWQGALFVEPVAVFATGKYRENFQHYMGRLLRGFSGCALASSLVLLVFVMGYWKDPTTCWALVGMALAAPFLVLIPILRRFFYALLTPQLAALGGLAYFSLMVAGLWALQRGGLLSAASALFLMGAGSLLVSLGFITRLRPKLKSPDPRLSKEIVTDHWKYGRWFLAKGYVSWGYTDLVLFLVTLWVGIEATSTYRAFQNLTLPMWHAMSALSALMLSWSVGWVEEKGPGAVKMIIARATAFGVLLAGGFALFLLLFQGPIQQILLGGRFIPPAGLLLVLALEPVAFSLSVGVQLAWQIDRRSSPLFLSELIGTGIALVGYLYFIPRNGLMGAALIRLLSYFCQSASAIALYTWEQKVRKPSLQPDSLPYPVLEPSTESSSYFHSTPSSSQTGSLPDSGCS